MTMANQGKVLLLSGNSDLFKDLVRVLRELRVATVEASGMLDLRRRVPSSSDFLAVLTENERSGGRDVLRHPSQLASLLPVILVSRVPSLDAYLAGMEAGACDFIAPPFLLTDVARALMNAAICKTQDGPARAMSAAGKA
jgi:DNA-binding NtrC family response regulator